MFGCGQVLSGGSKMCEIAPTCLIFFFKEPLFALTTALMLLGSCGRAPGGRHLKWFPSALKDFPEPVGCSAFTLRPTSSPTISTGLRSGDRGAPVS